MTIDLVAVAPDGWGLFRTEEGPWLLRPPFRAEHRFKLSETQVARALAEEDFEAAAESFADWGAAARFLEKRVEASVSAQELEAARTAALRLLARATAEQATRHLDRLQKEIEVGRGAKARPVLRALLSSPEVSRSAQLVMRIADLMLVVPAGSQSIRVTNMPQRDWRVGDEAGVARLAALISQQGALLKAVA